MNEDNVENIYDKIRLLVENKKNSDKYYFFLIEKFGLLAKAIKKEDTVRIKKSIGEMIFFLIKIAYKNGYTINSFDFSKLDKGKNEHLILYLAQISGHISSIHTDTCDTHKEWHFIDSVKYLSQALYYICSFFGFNFQDCAELGYYRKKSAAVRSQSVPGIHPKDPPTFPFFPNVNKDFMTLRAANLLQD